MVHAVNLSPQMTQNVSFCRKNDIKQQENVDIIDQAYKITNDVPEDEKFFSPGADLAFPLVFALPYAYGRSDCKLNRISKKLAKARANGNSEKVKTLTEKFNITEKLKNEGVNIKAVTNPKAAFKEYGGVWMPLFYLVMQGFEAFSTYNELGKEAGIKQAFRGVANTALSTVGWVGGSALGHMAARRIAPMIGRAVGSVVGGPAGRFVGNLVGSVIGFIGGSIGDRLLSKLGEKIYGKSELTQAKEAQYKQDLKNLDLNDKTTIKQQIVKNQQWLMQFADEAGNINLTGRKKIDEKLGTVAKATEELNNKFKAVGGTDEELMAAIANPEETLSQKSRMNNDKTNMYYSGAFNSATAKGDPRFNGYTQSIFA